MFLLDTGASFSSVDRQLVPLINVSAITSVLGPCGTQVRASRSAPVTFQIADQTFQDPAPIALDLEMMSEQEGVHISGVLGFPILVNTNLTIDYRRGFVELARKH